MRREKEADEVKCCQAAAVMAAQSVSLLSMAESSKTELL